LYERSTPEDLQRVTTNRCIIAGVETCFAGKLDHLRPATKKRFPAHVSTRSDSEDRDPRIARIVELQEEGWSYAPLQTIDHL
jgi:hypothetical protein